MKIAIVCPYAWDRVGGVQSHVRALGRTLRGRGHEVQILAPSSMTLTHQLAGGEDVKLVGRAVGVPANGSVAPLAFGPLAATGIRVALRDYEPDVVHLHEPLVPSLSLLALLNTKAPTVGTFHAAHEESRAYSASRPILKRAMKRLDVRTAVSDAARDLISEYFPGDYALTPNGVEFDRFADATPMDLGPGKKILFLGRLERRKGLEVLLRAAAHLGDLDVELIVAGTGPLEKSNKATRRGARRKGSFPRSRGGGGASPAVSLGRRVLRSGTGRRVVRDRSAGGACGRHPGGCVRPGRLPSGGLRSRSADPARTVRGPRCGAPHRADRSQDRW